MSVLTWEVIASGGQGNNPKDEKPLQSCLEGFCFQG